MKPRFSPSSDRFAWKWQIASLAFQKAILHVYSIKRTVKIPKKLQKLPITYFENISKKKNWRRVTRLMKKKSWRLLKQYRYIESVNVVILTLPKLYLIDKRIQFAVQEEQLYAECGARLKNFHSSSLLWICLSLFETDLNKAKYSIYEKLSTVFGVARFLFWGEI